MIPGFSWAKSVGPKLPKLPDGSCPAWCPATHFGSQTQGTCKIKFEDGTETTINAGDSYLVDKPHLPEIIGDETVLYRGAQQISLAIILDLMEEPHGGTGPGRTGRREDLAARAPRAPRARRRPRAALPSRM